MKTVSAKWEISLEVWCPYCKNLVDIFDDLDLVLGQDEIASEGPCKYVCECGNCGEEFEVNEFTI